MNEENQAVEEKKAYDLKDLLAKLKDSGLDLAEDAAGDVLRCVFSWVKESAILSENKMDDMIVPLMLPVEAYIMSLVDKIDGKEG